MASVASNQKMQIGPVRWKPPPASSCATRELLDRVGDKWSLLILVVLAEGDMRFNALRRHVTGISQRILTTTLRGLERDGFISRTVTPSLVAQVHYALTPFGVQLLALTRPLMQWSNSFDSEVREARYRFDADAAD